MYKEAVLIVLRLKLPVITSDRASAVSFQRAKGISDLAGSYEQSPARAKAATEPLAESRDSGGESEHILRLGRSCLPRC